ncbi:tetratricopeptide repeat protein, partial [Kitasatospora sp. NPDC001574]
MTTYVRPEDGVPGHEPFEQRPRAVSSAVTDGNPHAEQRAVVLTPEAEAAALAVEAAPKSHHLPPRPTGELVGREAEVDAIGEALAEGGGLVTQAATLHGLGGVGKTALALHYAYKHVDTYGLIWWITAESEEQIAEALADLAVHLHRDWALTEPLSRQAEWAVAWLRAHENWLLVFDNVEDPVHLAPYLSRLLGRGHQLVTSRRADGWHQGIRPIRIDVLDAPLAVQLLWDTARPGEEPAGADEVEQAEARALADELGHLPLALSQAGAHVQQARTTFGAFRELLRAVAPSESPAMPSALDTVSRLWRTTLHTVGRTAPFAVELLRTLAWYAPEALPSEALRPFGSRSPKEVDTALKVLAGYHLITLGPQTVAVHRLLRSVLRAGDQDRRVRSRAERNLAAAVARLWPEADQEARRALLPHIRELASSVDSSSRPTPETIELYRLAAEELPEPEQRVFVIPLVAAVADGRRRLLGADHPETLAARGRLAELHARVGDPARAVELCRAVVADRSRAQGPDHPAVLADRHSLAHAYRKAGDHGRAVEEFRTVVTERARVLGADHPDTLAGRAGLAYALQVSGHRLEAVAEFELLQEDLVRVLGPDHADTLAGRNSLAYAQLTAGEHRLALTLYAQAVTDRTRVLGADHPDTLTSRGWLAAAHAAAGDH